MHTDAGFARQLCLGPTINIFSKIMEFLLCFKVISISIYYMLL